jgi:hypothetical protein
VSKKHLKEFMGFGVAGNFAHHLEQAGESRDFVGVETAEENAPKGMFPFYMPLDDTFLGVYPLSSSTIVAPVGVDGNLQMEPEIALICEISYDKNGVKDLNPIFFTAYNDCSIRKEGAKKISEKKNWGENTKGISSQILPIDKFEDGSILDTYHIASFLKRDGVLHEYGQDSAAITYNYFYKKLKNWMVDKLNTQKDFGPLEDLSKLVQKAGYPKGLVVSIGATSYTAFGESTFLKSGDEIFVYVYDCKKYTLDEIKSDAINPSMAQLPSCSKLHQKVV